MLFLFAVYFHELSNTTFRLYFLKKSSICNIHFHQFLKVNFNITRFRTRNSLPFFFEKTPGAIT